MTQDLDLEPQLVAVRAPGGDVEWTLVAARLPPEWSMELIAPDQRYIGHGSNCFAALPDLRRQLDERGISIGVNGARPNCTVSGLLADMGEGRSVYALQMGARGRPPTLPTLGPAPLDHVGTVAQQDAFCELWLAGRKQ